MSIAMRDYTKSIKRTTVLDAVNVTFDSGKIHGIVGPNGSGKTMLLRAICGFIHPDSGCVEIDGEPVGFNRPLPSPMGVIIETPGFCLHETAMENLKYLAGISGRFDADETARLLDVFGLYEHRNQKVKSFSLGMRQKLAIVQALMEHQPIVLLDEPTNGLDEESVEVFLEEMQQQRNAGKTILIATHHSAELEQVADRLHHISHGSLRQS